MMIFSIDSHFFLTVNQTDLSLFFNFLNTNFNYIPISLKNIGFTSSELIVIKGLYKNKPQCFEV